MALLVVLSGAVSAQPAAAEQETGYSVTQAHPCHDGRYSDGKPRSCEDLLDWIDRGQPNERFDDHPCRDGRYSDGRPRSCKELLEWLERRRWRAPR